MVDLPQELVDAIIEEVAFIDQLYETSDCESLKACAIAGRMFVGPCQRRLFRTLSLDSSGRRLEAVANILTASPHLALYVQDLYVDVYLDANNRHHIPLSTILTMLTGVRRLMMSPAKPRWESVPQNLVAAFCSLLALPTLHCFGLAYCTVPAELIRYALSSYAEVALIAIQLDHRAPVFPLPPRDPGRPPVALNRLTIQSSLNPDSLRAVIMHEPPKSLQSVRHMELSVLSRGTLNGLEEIAITCGPSLEHLVIDFRDLYDDSFDLPQLSSLRFLTFKLRAKRLHFPRGLEAVMATLPGRTPHLEVMTAIISSEFYDHTTGKFTHSRNEPVDEALNNLARLRDVHFRISLLTDDGWSRFRESLRQELPVISQAGLLSFSECNWDGYTPPMAYFSN
ncbi:hypothetical protein MVEN_01110700 [Mycena venus]|uniref:Uncharacterized protein n=1 Tax=Mycena venus TaxID=2733690 RepID=A0A8H6Y9E2_9AGAR|nr:hypothetical protein MVEN_01110700 [Mycena venus]